MKKSITYAIVLIVAAKGAIVGGIAGATGGFVGTGVTAASGSALLGSAVGGGVGAYMGEATSQTIDIATGHMPGYDGRQLSDAAAIGAVAGPVLHSAARGVAKVFCPKNSPVKSFFEGTKLKPEVAAKKANLTDLRHSFPDSIDGYAAEFGTFSMRYGGDGKMYQWLEVRGSYKGTTGTFQ